MVAENRMEGYLELREEIQGLEDTYQAFFFLSLYLTVPFLWRPALATAFGNASLKFLIPFHCFAFSSSLTTICYHVSPSTCVIITFFIRPLEMTCLLMLEYTHHRQRSWWPLFNSHPRYLEQQWALSEDLLKGLTDDCLTEELSIVMILEKTWHISQPGINLEKLMA